VTEVGRREELVLYSRKGTDDTHFMPIVPVSLQDIRGVEMVVAD